MEKAGERWWPYLGAVYIVQAIKRVKGMRLIGPVWSEKHAQRCQVACLQPIKHIICNRESINQVWIRLKFLLMAPARETRVPGGWGVLFVAGEREKELFGGELNTTNNRMELTAVIEALNTLTRPCEVVVHTDSQYVLKGITEWIEGWKARGWKTAAKAPVKNVDLWPGA